MNTDRPITEGEYIVDRAFNPGGNEKVDMVQKSIAELIDYLIENSVDPRLLAEAKTQLEYSSMIAVKSVVKPPRPPHLAKG